MNLHVLEKQQLTQSFSNTGTLRIVPQMMHSSTAFSFSICLQCQPFEWLWRWQTICEARVSRIQRDLANDIETGIRQHGIVQHKGKQIYAYEVDGLGHYNLMDDANIPSLWRFVRGLSLSLSLSHPRTHTHTQTQSTHSIHRTRRVRS